MMVADGRARARRRLQATRSALWHDTTARLASIIFPLAAVLMLTAHSVIVLLFTTTLSRPACRCSWCGA